MKQILTLALLCIGGLTSANAQVDLSKLITGNVASPEAIAAGRFGPPAKAVWIFYHAPSVRDPKTKEARHIFNGDGALQPDGSVWRLGADFATILHTDADLDINGLTVPKGEYTLYVDLDKGNWKLIVNKQLMAAQGGRYQWGINMDNTTTNTAANEVGRADMKMGKPPAKVETLKIAVTRVDGTHGSIDVAFENVTASVPFTVK